MAAIRGRNNKTTEALLVVWLRRNGITGWRRHLPLPGRPDFAFKQHKVAIFIDGCFWHGCPQHYRPPSSNPEFWFQKVESNRFRDRVANLLLRKKGWRVLRIWEHELKRKSEARVMRRIARALVDVSGHAFGMGALNRKP